MKLPKGIKGRERVSSLVAALVATMVAAPALASDAFLAEFEDLPLAPGLTELPGGMLFESPTGRIVDASAAGPVGEQTIKAFYSQSLPELGWQRVDDDEYKRDNEILRIDVKAGQPTTTVRFSVVPQ